MKRKQFKEKYFDGDCPDGILFIMDNKGKTFDRYTVLYEQVHGDPPREYLIGRGMSSDPFHPQGFGQMFEMPEYNVASYRMLHKSEYIKWSELPEKVKQCIRQDLEVNSEIRN